MSDSRLSRFLIFTLGVLKVFSDNMVLLSFHNQSSIHSTSMVEKSNNKNKQDKHLKAYVTLLH